MRTRECQYTNRRYAPAWHRVSGMTQFVWMIDTGIDDFLKKVIEAAFLDSKFEEGYNLAHAQSIWTGSHGSQYCMYAILIPYHAEADMISSIIHLCPLVGESI